MITFYCNASWSEPGNPALGLLYCAIDIEHALILLFMANV